MLTNIFDRFLQTASLRKQLLCLLFAGLLTPLACAQATNSSENGAPEVRLENVKKLLTSSTAVKKVESSGNAEAQAMLEDARGSYQAAIESLDAGDAEQATALLDKATRTVFDAVRQVGTEGVVEEKQQTDYENRIDSVKALMAARIRIREEKAISSGDDELVVKLDALLVEAGQLADKQDYVGARSIADEAYALVKTDVEELRGGDTLVRSLHFASKEEEYHYEVDRNDTHNMLYEVLIQEKKPAQSTIKMTRNFVNEAVKLRKQAEGEAARGNYEAAIELLESSTKNLVRAIRGAGIYIPG